MQPLLSVLITSLPERLEAHLLPLWRKLTAQAAATGAPTQVELVSLLDNRTRTIGEKREDLVQIARGHYVAFVDDDDDISPDYLPQLLAAIATTSLTPHTSRLTPHTSHLTPHASHLTPPVPFTGPDVITFEQRAIIAGVEGHCIFGLGQPNEDFRAGRFLRNAWHICAWRRDLARQYHFPIGNDGEDWAWASQLCAAARTSHHIPAILHHYHYDPKVSAATPGVDPWQTRATPFTWRDIPGWFDFPELYAYVVQKFPSGSTFIEGGVWLGQSTAFLLTAIQASGKKIAFTAYDTFKGSVTEPRHLELVAQHGGSILAAARANLARACGPDGPTILVEADFATAAAQHADASVDFCFIDCDHTEAAVRRDIMAWLPKMKPGGFLAGHDIDSPGVYAAVTGLLAPLYHLQQSGRCWICPIPEPAIGAE